MSPIGYECVPDDISTLLLIIWSFILKLSLPSMTLLVISLVYLAKTSIRGYRSIRPSRRAEDSRRTRRPKAVQPQVNPPESSESYDSE